MLIFQPPVNFCSDENIQTIFGTKLEDFSNYRIDYNSISQTVEKVVKKIFFSAPKASKSGDRQVLVEPTMALLWRPLAVLLFRRPENIFSQLFRQFGILNCNLSDSLKNLPTLFQKWFEYFHRNCWLWLIRNQRVWLQKITTQRVKRNEIKVY
jgi:hypothetical protein